MHAVAVSAPTTCDAVPCGQGVQALFPESALYFPGMQSTHVDSLEAPSTALHLPALQ